VYASRGRCGETRSLDRKHRTDTTVTDCGQQSLEAWTGNAAPDRPRSSSMISTVVQPAAWLDQQAHIVVAGFQDCARADPG